MKELQKALQTINNVSLIVEEMYADLETLNEEIFNCSNEDDLVKLKAKRSMVKHYISRFEQLNKR